MKLILSSLLACFLLTASAAAGDGLWEDEVVVQETAVVLQELPVTLKEKSTVEDEYIRLGDLFDGLDDSLDDKIVSKSPALAKEVTLTADWLGKLARSNGIKWTPANNEVKIVVTRAAKEIAKEELLKAFTEQLVKEGMPKSAQVTLNKIRLFTVLPVNTAYEIVIEKAEYTPATYAVSGTARIMVDGKALESMELSGKAVPIIRIPIAERTLASGQIITDKDVSIKSVREDILRNEIPARMEDLIGKEIKRTVRAGQPLTKDDVRTKVMVPKGKTVTLSFTKKGILLSTQGKALENGGLGDTVRVMNLQSKTVVTGTVTGPETVVISSGN